MNERMRSGGPRAWNLVTRLVGVGHSRSDLAFLGAGPLQDLIQHDVAGLFVCQIERAAAVHDGFAIALCSVWMTEDVPAPVRLSLANIGARDFVAEAAMTPANLAAFSADRTAKGWNRPEDP